MDSFVEVAQPRGIREQSAGAAQCSQRRWFKLLRRPRAVAQFDTTFLEAHGMTRSLLLLLIGALTAGAPSIVQPQDSAAASSGNSQVEEIYVARAVRQSRISPTRFCDETRIGSGNTLFEDRFVFRVFEVMNYLERLANKA